MKTLKEITMKKVLLALVLSVGVLSADVDRQRDIAKERVDTMRSYAAALADIQKGFLYNNESLVKKGVGDFQKNLRHSDSFVIDLDKKNSTGEFNPRTYANTEARAISSLVQTLEENYKTGTKNESVKTYNEIVRRCLACHQIIRKW